MTGHANQLPRWETRDRALLFVDANGADVFLSADDIYRALVEKKSIDGIDGLRPPEDLKLSRYPLVPTLTLALDQQRTPFLTLTGRCGGTVEDLSMADMERGHVTVRGNWFPIDPALAAEISTLLADLGATLGPCSVQTFLGLRKAAANGGPVEDLIGSSPLSPLAFTPTSEDVPGVDATLYGYQLAGWRWLRFIRSEGLGGVLADEMGLGKSLQVIAAIHDPGIESAGPCLIVAPGSLLENWRREIARFAPDLRVLKHHGPARTGRPAGLQGYDVVVTSYDTVVRDNSLLNMIEWDMAVLDEAQFIRNPDAQRAKAAKRLHRRVGLAVTGTPIENRLLDLWSIVDFVLPGQLGDRRSFDASYPDDLDGARMLELDVSPFMLRRRIAEVAQDLPPRIDIPQVVELSQGEAAAYEATRQRIADEYGAIAPLASLTALRKFCAHPQLMMGGAAGVDYTDFSKFERLDEILREIFLKGEKVLIFASFTAMIDIIARHVRSILQAFAGVIDGRLPADDRQSLIDEFTAVHGSAALVLNPRAGGAGLNITAANHVIHYTPEWNPAMEDQASARAHRRGQELPVTVHRLLAANTVEEVISDRLDRKRSIAETAVIGVTGEDDDYTDIIAALSRSPLRQT